MTGASSTVSAEPDALPAGWRRTIVTIALILGPLLQVFDTSVVSIALVQMQGSLSATQDQISWVLTSYLVAITMTTPLWGTLGARFGRKRLLLISIAGFTAFSLLAGLSSSLTEILIYRFLQGAVGAALIPLALSSLLSVYPREDVSIAMGYWGVGIMFGPVFGPTLGGYIAEFYGWRWAFYLNFPIGLTAFAMIAVLVPTPAARTSRKFNYWGFVLLAVGVGALQFVLDRGNRLDWFESHLVLTLALFSAACLWMFVVNSLTSPTPFIDPAIFSDRNYVAGTILRVLFGAVLFGSLVLIPPFLQNQGGYSPLDSGWLLAPRGLGAMFAAIIISRLIKVVDPRKVMATGMLVIVWTMFEFSNFTNDIDAGYVVVICFIQGVAFGSFIIPVNSVAFSTLAADQRDAGTSFYSLLNNIGRNLGISLLATYLAYQSQAARTTLSVQITPFNDYFLHQRESSIWTLDSVSGLAALERVVGQQAELIAYIDDFRLLAIVVLLCVPVVFAMNNPLRLNKQK